MGRRVTSVSLVANVTGYVRSVRTSKQETDELRRAAERFAKGRYEATADVDTSGAKGELSALERQLEAYARSDPEARANLDTDEAQNRLRVLQERLREVGREVTDAKVDIDDDEAQAKLSRLEASLLAIGKRTAEPDIDLASVAKAEADLGMLEARLSRFDGNTYEANVRIDGTARMSKQASLIVDALFAIGPAAIAASGAAGGALVALGGTAESAAAGFATLAGGLSGVTNAVEQLNKIRLTKLTGDDPEKADFQNLKEAFVVMSDEGKDFARFIVNDLIPGLEELRRVAEQNMLPGFQRGLLDAKELVPEVTDVVRAYSRAWGRLGEEAGEALTDPFWQDYFDFLARTGAGSMSRMARAIGNVVEGFAAIHEAFFPLQRDMEKGILGWARAFNRWAQNLDKTEGFKDFLAYVDRVGPKALDAVAAIAEALLAIAEAAAPIGEVSLPIIEALARVVEKIAQSEAGPVLVGIGAGLATVNRSLRVFESVKASNLVTTFGAMNSRADAAGRSVAGFGSKAQTSTQRLASFNRQAGRMSGALGGLRRNAGAAGGIAGLGLLAGSLATSNDELSTFLGLTGGGALAGSAFGPWGAVIGGAAGAVAGLAVALHDTGEESAYAKPKIEDYIDTLDKLSGATTRATRKQVIMRLEQSGALEIADKLGIPLKTLVDATLGNAKASDRYANALHRAYDQGGQNAELARKLSILVQDQRNSITAARQAQERMTDANLGGAKSLKELSDRIVGNSNRASRLANELDRLEERTRKHTGSAELNEKQLRRVAEKLHLNSEQTEDLVHDYLDLARRTDRNTAASKEYDDALFQVGRQSGLTRNQAELLTDKIRKQEEANERLTGKSKLSEDQLRKVARQMGLTKQETQELIEKYNDVPKDVRTEAHFEDDRARRDVERFVNWTERKWEKFKTVSPGFFGPDTIHVPGGQAATGGYIRGPGTKTSDSVPMRLSHGEFVQQATAVDREGVSAMHALNQGRATIVPLGGLARGGQIRDALALDADTPAVKVLSNFRSLRSVYSDFLRSMLAPGRVGAALRWARKQEGDDYQLGAVGPSQWDCSGFMSGIVNFLRGNPLHSRVGTTATFPWPGFARGADPRGFTIGSTPSYPGSSLGHMAGTLGGVNVESSGGVGVRVGPGARGFNDPGFTEVYHLTGIPKGPGGPGGGDIGALSRAERWIIRRESGGSVYANNRTSSAFGLGQLLEANRIHYARKLGYNWGIERGDTGSTNRVRQIDMFRAYVRDRYGTAERAKAFHQSHGWYDQGGSFPHGTIGINTSGGTEEVLTPLERSAFRDLGKWAHMSKVHAQTGGGGGGGNSFNGRLTGTFKIVNWEQGVVYFQGVANDNYNRRDSHAARLARMG